MNDLRVLYEKHPDQGSDIINGITEAWCAYETEGKFWRLLKINIQEKIAERLRRSLNDLKFYEKPRRTFFFRVRQVIVHCPYCDRFKYVNAGVEGQEKDREVSCERCSSIYRVVLTPKGNVYRQKITEVQGK